MRLLQRVELSLLAIVGLGLCGLSWLLGRVHFLIARPLAKAIAAVGMRTLQLRMKLYPNDWAQRAGWRG